MRIILTSLSVVIFYIFYVPIVFIKDIASLLLIPFDSNRIMTAWSSFIKNIYAANVIWDNVDFPTEEQPQERHKIGFEQYPIINHNEEPSELENLSNPESPQ